MTKLVSSIAVLIALSAGPALAQDIAAGEKAYAVCASCHGANGEGVTALNGPRLAGLQAGYLTRQLANFKGGIRGADPKDVYGAQMAPMSMTLADDAAIENVVAYIGTLEAPKPEATVDGDAAAGKAAYGVCQSCHGANGEGIDALNAPRLAGQHDWYIVRQLKNYKAGIRGTNPKDAYGAQMRPMSMTLADEAAVKNVAAYIATLD